MNGLGAGQLTRRVRIQSRSLVIDTLGEPQPIWSDVASVWAEIQPLTGRELESAQRTASEISHQITVRYQDIFADTRVVAGYRALYKTRVFNIHACLNEDEHNAVITLLASEGLNDG